MKYDIKKAARNNHVNTYEVGFLCAETGMQTHIILTGVGLAGVEYGQKGTQYLETVIYLDNGQFFHAYKDMQTDEGTYRFADTLEGLGEMYICLKEKAEESLKYKFY